MAENIEMLEREWVGEIVDVLVVAPFNWTPEQSRDHAEGLLSFAGLEKDPIEAFEEERLYWTPATEDHNG